MTKKSIKTVEDVWQTIHQFSREEFDQLMELLELEKQARSIVLQTGDPFQAIIGTWSDAAIDEFEALIEADRKKPPRPFSFDWDDEEP